MGSHSESFHEKIAVSKGRISGEFVQVFGGCGISQRSFSPNETNQAMCLLVAGKSVCKDQNLRPSSRFIKEPWNRVSED
jgi:hypothetical protein